ncbi:MAG: aminomethyl-transferring glycine dehydrogenase subunit GcvPB [Chloroflexi bacterium]|nr:aminomethyl-transferring glycine dehydrogenase subunit GcvPB [Chloroflexota bacterium]
MGSPGRCGASLPALDVPEAEPLSSALLREDLNLPELSEIEVVRHFTRLSQLNGCIDTVFYPLGSCTMKYNPKVNEIAARLPGFADIHPLQDPALVQGALQLEYELQQYLAEIAGMDACSLQPAAGAQGELTGMLLIRAYHLGRGDTRRRKVLVPDSAHGTNPATATMCGFDVVTLRSDKRGNVDLDQLRAVMDDTVVGLMITNPSTLGLFEQQIVEVTRIVHEGGGLVYGDGANLNALLGWARPGDLGLDVIHINLHKTFSTPHGGGGPGSGPVCCNAILAPFLPRPVVGRQIGPDGKPVYAFEDPPQSVGKVKAFFGNFGMHVRAYTYIRMHGEDGLRAVSENAVLNANYVQARLKDAYQLAVDRGCMHETVLSGIRQKARGVRTLDIAKRLIDFGFHPPTVYFPLIVEEAIMIEPTETETKQTLDEFCEAMLAIDRESQESPDVVRSAPHSAPVTRLDEATAARRPNLRWTVPGAGASAAGSPSLPVGARRDR